MFVDVFNFVKYRCSYSDNESIYTQLHSHVHGQVTINSGTGYSITQPLIVKGERRYDVWFFCIQKKFCNNKGRPRAAKKLKGIIVLWISLYW